MTKQLHLLNDLACHLLAFAELIGVDLCAKETPGHLALHHNIELPTGSTLPSIFLMRIKAALDKPADLTPLGEFLLERRIIDWDRAPQNEEKRASVLSASVLCYLLRGMARLADESLKVRFLSGPSRRIVLEAIPTLNFRKVLRVLRRLQSEPDDSLTVTMILDKNRLLARHVQEDNVFARYFICRENATAQFSRPLTEIELSFQEGGSADKLVLLVALADIALDGEYLAIVGGEYLRDWQKYSMRRPPLDEAKRSGGESTASALDERRVRPREMLEDAVEKVNWIGLHFDILTPLHLYVTSAAPGYSCEECNIGRAVYSRLLDLCLVYSANQTRRTRESSTEERRADDWTATFGRADSLARVRFGTDAAAKSSVALPKSFRCGVCKVVEMVVWAYAGRRKDRDRIHALQNVIAQNLRGKPETESYAGLAALAEAIEREKDWFWATYWEGKLREYFDRITQVMKYVDEVRQAYENQIQRLTKSLTDNVLAGVAVVVGTFIAAMFKSEFNAALFRLGILLYTAYLFFFPAFLGLLAAWTQFRDARDTFAVRAKLFRAHLYEKSVASLLEPVGSAEMRFRCWFALTAFIYLAVCFLLVLGALLGPPFMAWADRSTGS